jgi:hypothetical protein
MGNAAARAGSVMASPAAPSAVSVRQKRRSNLSSSCFYGRKPMAAGRAAPRKSAPDACEAFDGIKRGAGINPSCRTSSCAATSIEYARLRDLEAASSSSHGQANPFHQMKRAARGELTVSGLNDDIAR